VNFDAVLPEAGVTRFECGLAAVGHREAPLHIPACRIGSQGCSPVQAAPPPAAPQGQTESKPAIEAEVKDRWLAWFLASSAFAVVHALHVLLALGEKHSVALMRYQGEFVD